MPRVHLGKKVFTAGPITTKGRGRQATVVLGSNQHIESSRLFNLSKDDRFRPTRNENKHLVECKMCLEAFVVLSRAFSK
jgi:hypothetical protein